MSLVIIGNQAQGLLKFCDRLVKLLLIGKRQTQQVVRGGVIGIDHQGRVGFINHLSQLGRFAVRIRLPAALLATS